MKTTRGSSRERPAPQPVPIYTEIRNRILTLNPHEVGLEPSSEAPHVWGVLMETGYPQAVVTLISLADGTTSLYFSSGGGIIGGGQHLAVSGASKRLVSNAEQYLRDVQPTTTFPLPSVGQVKFYILTFFGASTAGADENELGEGHHLLSPLFYSSHQVITQLRLLQSPGAHDHLSTRGKKMS